MGVGDAGDALDEPAVDPGPERHARAVRPDDDHVAGADAAAVGVRAGELDLGVGPLELRARARARPAGPENSECAADERQLAEEVLVGRPRLGRA